MEQRVKSEYAGAIELVLEQKDNRTITSKKYYEGLVKVSANIRNDREGIPTYYLLQLGGGYIEGERYKNIFRVKDNARAIITTQASTKVYKCEHGERVDQETIIELGKNSVLEYIADTVILYKDAIYKQINNIYLDDSSTLIYSDGITAGWSPEGERFTYNKVQLKSNVYINNKIV
ncbi:urease accessory protein UreD, partial [Clostridium saudiense]|nr:urease accessory protein UreD [Clostridium saudiense]